MRKLFVASLALAAVMFVATTTDTDAARRCYSFEVSHNGTDMFNPDGGAAGTAKNKLLYGIDEWKQEKRIKRVRIGKIRIKCGEWYVMYMLPHRTCTAKVRVCKT